MHDRKHNIPFDTVSVSLPDIDAAKDWIIKEHRGRRNLTEERDSFLRGEQYQLEKKLVGRPEGNGRPKQEEKLYHGDTVTRRRIAEDHGVSEATIARDAKFARNINTIAANVGEDAKNAILERGVKITRQEVQKLAEIAAAQPQTAKNVLVQIKSADKPQETWPRCLRGKATQLLECSPRLGRDYQSSACRSQPFRPHASGCDCQTPQLVG